MWKRNRDNNTTRRGMKAGGQEQTTGRKPKSTARRGKQPARRERKPKKVEKMAGKPKENKNENNQARRKRKTKEAHERIRFALVPSGRKLRSCRIVIRIKETIASSVRLSVVVRDHWKTFCTI